MAVSETPVVLIAVVYIQKSTFYRRNNDENIFITNKVICN